MDDEFTEFRSGDSVSEMDLLDLNTSSSTKKPVADDSFKGSFFSSVSEGLPRPPTLKKKTFVFPYDLDLNTNNLLESITSKAASKPTAWSLIENIEGLNKLSIDLAGNGRLSQSLKCKRHSETVGEIIRIKEIKRIATERADYDTAIQYRNLLGQLEKQLSTAEEIEEWLKEYKESTLKDLEVQVGNTLGSEVAAEFKEKFAMPEIKTSSDIELAQQVMQSAYHFINARTTLKDQAQIFYNQSQIVLQKINEELSKAITIFYKLKPHLPALSGDLELQTYFKCVPEVYFIAIRIGKIIGYCGAGKSFLKILQEIKHNWEELQEFLSIGIPEFKNELGENVCGLCLYSSKQLVLLCSSYFHVGCINFWINRVSTEPPKLITSSLYS